MVKRFKSHSLVFMVKRIKSESLVFSALTYSYGEFFVKLNTNILFSCTKVVAFKYLSIAKIYNIYEHQITLMFLSFIFAFKCRL